MGAKDMIDEFGDRLGWDDNSKIAMLCEYIDNQQSEAALRDFLQQKAEFEEDASEDEEEDEEPSDEELRQEREGEPGQ